MVESVICGPVVLKMLAVAVTKISIKNTEQDAALAVGFQTMKLIGKDDSAFSCRNCVNVMIYRKIQLPVKYGKNFHLLM